MPTSKDATATYHSKLPIDIRCQNKPYSVAFTKDRTQVICSDNGKTLRRWRVNDGQEIGTPVKVGGRVYSIEASQDGRWIVLAEERMVVVRDSRTSAKVLEMRQHKGQVGAIDVSADSTKIASGSEDGATYVFSITTGEKLLGPLEHSADVIGVKFSPNAERIATATPILVRVWNAKTGEKLIAIPAVSVSYPVMPFAWSSDSRYLFAATPGWITSIDVSTSANIDSWSFPSRDKKPPLLVSNGRFIACCTGISVYFLDISSRTQVGPIIKFPTTVRSIALSSDDSHLACGRVDNIISVYNLGDFLPQYAPLDPGCLPLMSISDAVFKSWIDCHLVDAEATLSEEITSSNPNHNLFANRALVQTRLRKWDTAIVDAKEVVSVPSSISNLHSGVTPKSLAIQPSPIGHIAMALALVGQGHQRHAFRAVDLAFRDCRSNDNSYLLLIKAILSFVCGRRKDAISRVQDLMSDADDDDAVVQCCIQVLINMYLEQGDYENAVQTLHHRSPVAFFPTNSHLATITLIFGWTFRGPDITVYQRLCESFYAARRIQEGAESLLKLINSFGEEIRASKASAEWVSDFVKKYAAALESLGNDATLSEAYDNAIVLYSSALSLDPPSKTNLLVKRSRVRATKKLWQEALDDADMAINQDPSSPWGYECRHSALHGMESYDEAIEALTRMVSMMEKSPDPTMREMRKNYVSPEQTIRMVDDTIRHIVRICPLVLIDVRTGRLCGTADQVRIFKAGTAFKELISSTTVRLDKARITQVVRKCFQYVMFSHVWEGQEPLFQDVNAAGSVWDLDPSPPNEKLCKFCGVVRDGEGGYRLAWSDTCCIDRTTSTVLNESLMSMYKWYDDSAETLIYLADVESPSSLGDLTKSLWMTRSWTLQELLAPKIVRFYDRNWKPYLNDTRTNHKESPEIMQELTAAMHLAPGSVLVFCPSDLTVREKLRLAAMRTATIEEDEAYSLIGIFSSDIRPHYGEREAALGHLLEEIVSRSGDVTVLAWTGKSSTYNSCLPASLLVYSRAPLTIATIDASNMETQMKGLRRTLSAHSAKVIYRQITRLPPARFANRRLYLPCIVFPVKRLGVQRLGSSHLRGYTYLAKVSGLGKAEFSTTDVLPLQEPRKIVFVHPWIRDVRGGDGRASWADEPDSDLDSNADKPTNTTGSRDADSDTDAISTPLSAVPSAEVDDFTQALLTIVRSTQPFSALVLLEQSDGSFKRVASENAIVVRIEQGLMSWRDIRAKVVEMR